MTPVLNDCKCPVCIGCCQRNPGWFTPDEARAAIAAGLAGKLMRDWLEPCATVGNEERIYLLAPASVGCEGKDAPEFSFVQMFSMSAHKGPCVLLKDGLCSIHDSGYKPIQCRLSFACDDAHSKAAGYPDNYAVARIWQSKEGRAVLRAWKREVKL